MGVGHSVQKASAPVWVGPFCFLFAIAATTIVLWSDREWLEMAVDQQLRSIPGEGTEAEISRRALETAIDTGAMGYLLAMRTLWIVGRSHLLFFLVFCLLLGTIGGCQELFGTILVPVSRSYLIPAVGVLLNAILRWNSVRMNATFSAGFFIESYDGRLFWHQLAVQADLFIGLFFVRIAFLASKACHGKPIHLIGLMIALWFITICAAYLLNIVFELAA